MNQTIDFLDSAVSALVEGKLLDESYSMAKKLSDEANELLLFIENDADLYRQQHVPIQKNLMRKIAVGKYDQAKAEKLFMHLVENGAKFYAKNYGDKSTPWHKMFTMKDRKAVAKQLAYQFKMEADNGEHDDKIPKKYQKKK
jgi:hypothetical protein